MEANVARSASFQPSRSLVEKDTSDPEDLVERAPPARGKTYPAGTAVLDVTLAGHEAFPFELLHLAGDRRGVHPEELG